MSEEKPIDARGDEIESEQVAGEAMEQEEQSKGRLVPVSEPMKYRRRAQQAEAKVEQLASELAGLQQSLREAQEGMQQQHKAHAAELAATRNKLTAERMLAEAGVVDVEAASLLLGERVRREEPLEAEELAGHVEQLLLDKPFLRGDGRAVLPPATAGANGAASGPAELSSAADRAAASGDRRDVAAYLRLRRQQTLG